jgi:hypothetical protein
MARLFFQTIFKGAARQSVFFFHLQGKDAQEY